MTTTREPQQDRSRATRARLLDATVEALADLGWSGTTVSVVAERARVSRGAAQHHYPTREDLVAAAVAHIAAARMADLDPSRTLPPGPDRTLAVVRAAVDFYLGPLFRAAVQLWGAAASDPVLREQILPLESTLGAGAHRAVVAMLGVDDARPEVREVVQATLDLARGLGLADLLTDDAARRERVVRRYAAMLHAELAALGA
ncbi:TetR/AcrR family transcriptional regulator [Jatrophihabitans sp. YIM 134969]